MSYSRPWKDSKSKMKTTFPTGDAHRQVPRYERQTGFSLKILHHMLGPEQGYFLPKGIDKRGGF